MVDHPLLPIELENLNSVLDDSAVDGQVLLSPDFGASEVGQIVGEEPFFIHQQVRCTGSCCIVRCSFVWFSVFLGDTGPL